MNATTTTPARIAAYLAAKAREPGNRPLLAQRLDDVLDGARYINGRNGLQLRGPSGRWMGYRRALAAWAAC